MAYQSTVNAVSNYNDKLTQVGLRAVIISVGTMSLASVLVAIAFNLLRPSNDLIYSTRIKYAGKNEEDTSKGYFDWIKPMRTTREEELLELIGLDAVVFIRFMKMLSWIFTLVALIAGGSLITVNVLYNLREVESDQRNALSDLTIQNLKGEILWVHIGVSYLMNIIVLGFIGHNYRRITKLRGRWFHSPSYLSHIYSRTLSVIRLPENEQSDRKFSSLIKSLSLPYTITSASVGRKIGSLPRLIEDQNEVVVKLEKVLAKYLKGGKVNSTKRPTMKINSWHGIFGGEKVDSIDFLTSEAKRLGDLVEGKRQKLDAAEDENTNYGFVTMASASLAHRNARYLDRNSKKLKPLLKGAKVSIAPNANDIIWDNLEMTEKEQNPKRIAAGFLLFVVCAFWTLPVLVISFLANLTSLSTFIPFLVTWQEKSIGTFSAVSGILPPVTSALFAILIPILIRKISRMQGISTKTELSRIVLGRYFDFLFVSQLIVFSLISVLFNLCVQIILQIGQGQSVASVFQNFSNLPKEVASTYLIQSTYWITFAPARGFSAVFDLAQLINLVTITVSSKFTGSQRTPRQAREWMKPKAFPFEIYTANLLFLATVGLAYAILAPVVAVVIAIVLWIWFVVYKYQLMFVFITEVDSGGRMWPIIVNRMLIALSFSNLLLALTIALARSWYYFLTLAPPTLIIIIFKIYLSLQYSDNFMYFISKDKNKEETEVSTHTADARLGRLQKRFEHPALHTELYVVMVDASLAPLLDQVYTKTKETLPTEDGNGTQMLATVEVADGLKIASVEESQIEIHEEEVDTRSVASISDDDEGLDFQDVLRKKKAKAKQVLEKFGKVELNLPFVDLSIPFGNITGTSSKVPEKGNVVGE